MFAGLNNNPVSFPQAMPPDWPGNAWWHWVIFTVIILVFFLGSVIMFIYMERRVLAKMQARIGPNRVGPFGLLQAIADAVKVLMKEMVTPANADKIVYWLAPAITFAPVVMVLAVVPFADGALLADLNIGILYVLAISSLSSIGVFMAGWSSNNKYSLIGAMRMVAAVVSYEMPIVLALASVVLIAGSMSLNDIVIAQQSYPMLLMQPLAFLLMFIAGCAEINRSPFDLMEADSEIVAGFHTEYTGMKFALFYLAEYGEAVVMSSVIATVFLGGWQGPFLWPWLWFILKTFFVFFLMIWTRTTLPRVRIDQLMSLAWKFLFPLALINLIFTGIEVLTYPDGIPWYFIFANIAIGAILVLLWSRLYKVGGGRIAVG
ncbi:MAG: NADH-quinone oxidoreductase subunit NuoH [Dehalococcoidales bacterium]|nr:NADH-quinone oxidoreductase subunit NuoH [Dehalococcoidales bacterium]